MMRGRASGCQAPPLFAAAGRRTVPEEAHPEPFSLGRFVPAMMCPRFICGVTALCLALTGSASTLARASTQAPQLESAETEAAQAGASPRRFDRYDVGAVAANLVWLPVKGAT